VVRVFDMALSTEKHDIATTVDRMARRIRSVGAGGGGLELTELT
jgi:hypothetical protein